MKPLRQPIEPVAARDLSGSVGLLPSLADEFFRRGVRNYIGTAGAIHDEGAIGFATHLWMPARAAC